MIVQRNQQPVHLTYCSNLHPIENPEALLSLAETLWPDLAKKLRARFQSEETGLDLGLWLSNRTVREFASSETGLQAFQQRLNDFDGKALTANAFPMGDFHAGRVKENVYLPDWQAGERLIYSKQVADHLSTLPCQSTYQSISTSPGSFKAFENVDLNLIAANLISIAEHLGALHQSSGRKIVMGIEPEPGCTFETTDEFVRFYEDILLRGKPGSESLIREHIGICFDCCHQAIQYEDPVVSLGKLRAAGIKIAKMQLSSALEIEDPATNDIALEQLGAFAEDRYLHQVVALDRSGSTEYFGDLPEYLRLARSRQDRSARIHFHVPIFRDAIGELGTTQPTLIAALNDVLAHNDCEHLEIETYSWSVMPERRGVEPGTDALIADIVQEYTWVIAQIKNQRP